MKHSPQNLGKVIAILVVILFVLVSCGPKPAALPIANAAPVQQATTAPAATSAPAATKAPAATVAPAATKAPAAAAPAAAATQTAPAVPAAEVSIIPVPGNPASKVAITTTIKMVTDTKVGPKNTTVAIFTSGLANVPISVPVKLVAKPADPDWKGTKVVWSLLKPAASKAKLAFTNTLQTAFTPDVVGAYMATATLQSDDGKTSGELGAVQLHSGTFVGVDAGKCSTCHPSKVTEWAKTGHARIFSEMIDNARTPDVPTHYSESCIRCHTTGYYPAPYGGSAGMKDAMTKANWPMPTFAQIDAAGKAKAKTNWTNAPAAVKNVGNIGCEDCHGPASEHVKGQAVMQSTQDEGVCNQCHNGGGHHLKGTDLQNAAHADATAVAWNEPTGPGEQACVRCHSGNGYVSFLNDPTNPAAWDNTKHTVVCSTCHDPHSEKNMFQLRILSKPIALPFEVTKDVGLSATCYECHNARNSAADYQKGQSSFPHYSSVAEFISDTGGVTYGKTVPNSPHGMMVGTAPVPNPAAKDDPEAGKFLFSKTDDTKGNVPGACVTCHMWPTIEDQKDPNWHKVGSHSFNTVSPDGKFDYTASCKTCHTTMGDSFNIKAKADYDGNGTIEGVQDEVAGLLDVVWGGLEAKGVKKIDTGYPYATLPKGADGKVDPKISNAWYNFRNVYGVMWGEETGDGNKGAAQSIHNFQRSVALLQLAYKDLTGKDVPNATILVK